MSVCVGGCVCLCVSGVRRFMNDSPVALVARMQLALFSLQTILFSTLAEPGDTNQR